MRSLSFSSKVITRNEAIKLSFPFHFLPSSRAQSRDTFHHSLFTKNMNYIKHLTEFFDRIAQDRNLNPTHISLYIALFQFWNVNRFQNPISITREEVMRISKIYSTATYHKCIKELNEKGYIKYEPSFNPFKGSMVILFNFSEDQNQFKKD